MQETIPRTITAAQAARARQCPLCESAPGAPCQSKPAGDHLARYLDAYTAGHSQRVQRIALAIAGELGLEGKRLDALRFGSLFHDIGKLRVPDAVLTKPASLTAAEFAGQRIDQLEANRDRLYGIEPTA